METIKSWGSYIYTNTAWAAGAAWNLGADAVHDLGSMYTEVKSSTTDILYDVATTSWQETSNKVDVDQVNIETVETNQEVFSVEKYPSESSPASVAIIPLTNEHEKSAVTSLVKPTEQNEKLDRNFD